MKVFHIITGLNDGGAEAVLYRMCITDTIATHVVVSMMGPGKYGPLLEEAGVEVYYLNMPRGRVSLSGLARLYRTLKQIKPDIVQTWMYHADIIGGLVSWVAGFKYIFWGVHHSILEKKVSKRSTILIAKLSAKLSNYLPHSIICCADKALTVHTEVGYQKDKMVVVYNGYQLDKFYINKPLGSNVRAELNIKDNEIVLGMVSRFDPQKDHENLLQSLALVKKELPAFKCLLVGADLNENNTILVAQVELLELESNIILLDQRDDIPAIMNALDIHLLSSFTEGFPNVLCEAMACGTPCVTTDVGDAAMIVGNTGWVVPPRDARALADATLQAINEKKNTLAWQQRELTAQQRIVDNFSIQTMVNNYHKVWELDIDNNAVSIIAR